MFSWQEVGEQLVCLGRQMEDWASPGHRWPETGRTGAGVLGEAVAKLLSARRPHRQLELWAALPSPGGFQLRVSTVEGGWGEYELWTLSYNRVEKIIQCLKFTLKLFKFWIDNTVTTSKCMKRATAETFFPLTPTCPVSTHPQPRVALVSTDLRILILGFLFQCGALHV